MALNNNKNVPQESFINLFSQIVYDSSQISQNSLDIWDAYQIDNIAKGYKTLPTFIYKPSRTDSLERLARVFYQSDRLWWVTLIVNNVEDPFTYIDDTINFNLNGGSINILKLKYIPQLVLEMNRVKAINDQINARGGST